MWSSASVHTAPSVDPPNLHLTYIVHVSCYHTCAYYTYTSVHTAFAQTLLLVSTAVVALITYRVTLCMYAISASLFMACILDYICRHTAEVDGNMFCPRTPTSHCCHLSRSASRWLRQWGLVSWQNWKQILLNVIGSANVSKVMPSNIQMYSWMEQYLLNRTLYWISCTNNQKFPLDKAQLHSPIPS